MLSISASWFAQWHGALPPDAWKPPMKTRNSYLRLIHHLFCPRLSVTELQHNFSNLVSSHLDLWFLTGVLLRSSISLTEDAIIPPFPAVLRMLNSLFHPCLCSTFSWHPPSTFSLCHWSHFKIWDIQDLSPTGLVSPLLPGHWSYIFRLNSCRLKWSLPPTARSHRLPPSWVSILLLLLCCLPTLKVAPASAEPLEYPICVSSVILDTVRAAHFLARIVLLVLMNSRKAWSSKDIWL